MDGDKVSERMEVKSEPMHDLKNDFSLLEQVDKLGSVLFQLRQYVVARIKKDYFDAMTDNNDKGGA